MNQQITLSEIQNRIIHLPDRKPFMLGQDLAEIYQVEPRQIKQAVKRNPERFPDDFYFHLTNPELENLRSQTVIANAKMRTNPLGFFREGANQLSTVLRSPIAAQRSVQIMRAFSAMEEKFESETIRKARQAEKRAQLEWQQSRAEGKTIRHQETDAIKAFIQYATAQGSKSASKYYLAITKMVNQALFVVAPDFIGKENFRDLLNGDQLENVRTAEVQVARVLQEEMKKEVPYKKIYQKAKARVNALAELIGKSCVSAGITNEVMP